MLLVKIRIFGLVQGVFLRHNVSKKAKELGVSVYVCNLDDGSVYADAQGEKAKLKELIKWIKSSPGRSKVKKVRTEWNDSGQTVGAGFEIRH